MQEITKENVSLDQASLTTDSINTSQSSVSSDTTDSLGSIEDINKIEIIETDFDESGTVISIDIEKIEKELSLKETNEQK